MPGFLKVRETHGPKHIYYAPVEAVEAWPDDYEVVDKTVYDVPGHVEYVTPEPAKPKTSFKAPASEDNSVGDEKEGDA